MAKKIGILCEQYFTFDGNNCLFGGGEKWFFDFVELLKKNGYETDCYQFSYSKWTKRYKTLVVRGLGNINKSIPNSNEDYMNGLNEFYNLTEKCDGIFLLSMNLALKTPIKPTISVSHGIMFDQKMPNTQQIYVLDNFKRWIRNTTKTISVDTNSIHIMQVYDSDVAKKFEYIPNYVNINEFTPSDDWNNTGRFRVLYPRRLQRNCRGNHIAMQAVDRLIDKYDDMDFIFCGKGNKEDTDYFMSWYNKQNKNRVKYMWKETKDMPNVYKQAEISLIPTIFSEGTALSALEALSSGNPLISTYVGGLSDICQNYVNGLLIKPNDVDALVDAIEYMYNNREHLKEMRKIGIQMSKAFSKDRWNNQIIKVVKEVYGEPK